MSSDMQQSEFQRIDEQPKAGPIMNFKRNEVINIEGFRYRVIQVCQAPHFTVTLQLIGLDNG